MVTKRYQCGKMYTRLTTDVHQLGFPATSIGICILDRRQFTIVKITIVKLE